MSLQLNYTLEDQPSRSFPLDSARVLIGTLLSNDIVLKAPHVEPIHAMIEDEGDEKIIVDLGSTAGVFVNDRKIEVEAKITAGDTITIGAVRIEVALLDESARPERKMVGYQTDGDSKDEDVFVERDIAEDHGLHELAPETGHSAFEAPDSLHGGGQTTLAEGSGENSKSAQPLDGESMDKFKGTIRYQNTAHRGRSKRKQDVLFSPRKAKPSGDVLEVVSYWGDTILDVELFHPTFSGFEICTIGVPPKAHFLAGGKKSVSRHNFASLSSNGYKVRLLPDMKARIRKSGEVIEKEGPAKLSLGRRDIIHVRHSAISYFLMFVKPPNVVLPPNKMQDPLLAMMVAVSMALYFLAVGVLVSADRKHKEEKVDDVWAMVNLPEKPEKKEPEKPKKKKPKTPKPKVKVAEKKKPPPKPKPIKPKPKIKPKKPIKVAKPKQKKPVKTPVKVAKPTKSLPKKKPSRVKSLLAQLKKQSSPREGMASTGAAKPDFKLAGRRTNHRSHKTGGAKGSGMGQRGGGRKGKGAVSVMGVEGVKNKKASGVNLSKLGLGAGKILKRTGAGAIHTKFSNSAGGAGGGSGHMDKNYGFGGIGAGSSLGLAGTGSAINNFGSGAGGRGSGQGGSGGLGGRGLGRGFGRKGAGGSGRGRAQVNVPPSGPLTTGGLTSQEVQAVIRANLNQIRHCYEQLLQRSPNASGKMKVRFIVAKNGRVSGVSVLSSSISDMLMKGCVTGKIRRWAFPRPRGGQPVTVKYPFVFNPL